MFENYRNPKLHDEEKLEESEESEECEEA